MLWIRSALFQLVMMASALMLYGCGSTLSIKPTERLPEGETKQLVATITDWFCPSTYINAEFKPQTAPPNAWQPSQAPVLNPGDKRGCCNRKSTYRSDVPSSQTFPSGATYDFRWSHGRSSSFWCGRYDKSEQGSFTVTAAASSCTPPFGTFGPGNWPKACWRPYADSSPFNTPIPPNPPLVPNSAAIVARVLGDISQKDRPNHLVANLGGTAGEPTYYSQSTDPVFILHCKGDPFNRPDGKCPIEGTQIRIPSGAQLEGGPDRHLTVIDQGSLWEYDLWQAKEVIPTGSTQPQPITSLPPQGGDLYSSWGGKTKIDSDGLADDDAPHGWLGDATAARFGSLAGRLRAEELEEKTIRHALFITIACDNGTFVFPARQKGQPCSKLGLPNQDAPPMGSRFQLDMTHSDIDALPIREWKKTILQAMATYGMYFGDTGAEGFFAIEAEAGNQYTSIGPYEDKWLTFGKANWELFDPTPGTPGDEEYVGKLYNRPDDPDPNFDWITNVWSKLRVIAP